MTCPAKLIPFDPQAGGRLTPYPRERGEFRYEDLDRHASPPPAPGQAGFLSFGCPRGHGNCGVVAIGNGFKPPPTPGKFEHSWQWDGNVEKPTLTPSINCLTGPTGNKDYPEEVYAGCGWHAYLTAGEFTGE